MKDPRSEKMFIGLIWMVLMTLSALLGNRAGTAYFDPPQKGAVLAITNTTWVRWVGHPMVHPVGATNTDATGWLNHVQIGLRHDGVVVWKEGETNAPMKLEAE